MPDLAPVYAELRRILDPYAPLLDVKRDGPKELYLDTRHVLKNGKPLFFGAVQIKAAYVSFHLMPVYVKPELLDSVPEALKARMQGKSCFNFKRVEPELFQELDTLTRSGFESYREQGFVDR